MGAKRSARFFSQLSDPPLSNMVLGFKRKLEIPSESEPDDSPQVRKIPKETIETTISISIHNPNETVELESQEEVSVERENATIQEMILPQAQLRYCPAYLDATFAQSLFEELLQLPFERGTINLYGKTFPTPRLQAWMSSGTSNTPSLYQKSDPLPWSSSMLRLKKALEDTTNFTFDYVLINLYQSGKDYISYHSDKEAIGEGRNVIASISLGCTRKFVIRHKKRSTWDNPKEGQKEFFLSHGSLIIMIGDETQQHWEHSVTKSTKAMGPRINLTFRHT